MYIEPLLYVKNYLFSFNSSGTGAMIDQVRGRYHTLGRIPVRVGLVCKLRIDILFLTSPWSPCSEAVPSLSGPGCTAAYAAVGSGSEHDRFSHPLNRLE